MDIKELAAKLLDAKTTQNSLKQQLSDNSKVVNKLQAELIAALEGAKLESVRTLGHSFTNIPKLNVTKSNEIALFDWLRANGYEGAVKETVHPQTLTRIVTESMEESGILPDGVETSTFNVISMRKSK